MFWVPGISCNIFWIDSVCLPRRQYRRVCLFELSKDLSAELDFMDTFSDENPKNYQIWHHRRVIAEKSREGKREADFTTKVFAVDAKNYHGWAHR